MLKIKKFLGSKSGIFVLSVVLGLGLSCVFKMSCDSRSCMVYKPPDYSEKKIIKYNNKELLEDKKISTPKLAEYLSKSLNKKITSDIIKNVWCGKTNIFDFEFIGKSISYEDYIKLTNKNSE